jgi:hypothetical protein
MKERVCLLNFVVFDSAQEDKNSYFVSSHTRFLNYIVMVEAPLKSATLNSNSAMESPVSDKAKNHEKHILPKLYICASSPFLI